MNSGLALGRGGRLRTLALALLAFVFLAAIPSPAHGYDQLHWYDGMPTVGAPESIAHAGLGTAAASASPDSSGFVYDSSAYLVATNTARPAVGFAPGEGASALTAGRLQHGTRHLTESGVLPAWRGSTSPQLIRDTLSPILEAPIATFDNALGGTAVKGFIGTVNGQTVAVQVFAEGPLAGQLATSVVPSANQLLKWGVVLP